MKFPVEVSARHAHLSQGDVDILFGEIGYNLTFDRALSQPGQFLCKEKVTINKGEKMMEGVSILGPTRKYSQVEISRTDSFTLKARAYLRDSGDIEASESVTIIGPKGTVELKEGLIVAQRHVHMTPQNAEVLNVSDKQIVNVAIESIGRKLIFGDVIVRVSPNFLLAMHIDTDEANAGLVPRDGCNGYLITL